MVQGTNAAQQTTNQAAGPILKAILSDRTALDAATTTPGVLKESAGPAFDFKAGPALHVATTDQN